MYPFSGGISSYTVPRSAAGVYVQVWGSGGSGGRYSTGGGGAYVAGWLTPLPPEGTSVLVAVGGGGLYNVPTPRYGGQPYVPGFGCCGTSAGAAAVSLPNSVPFVVAGAGGNGGESPGCAGGSARWDGVATASTNGLEIVGETNPACPGQTYGGRGASASAPGARGCGSTAGTWGTAGTGPLNLSSTFATGGAISQTCGGGGGGGYFGA